MPDGAPPSGAATRPPAGDASPLARLIADRERLRQRLLLAVALGPPRALRGRRPR